MSDPEPPTNYQYQQTHQEAQPHYGQMRTQYPPQQNNGHSMTAVSSNSGKWILQTAQLTATPSSQVQRFLPGISQQLHPNSPHCQLLQQLGQSAASPQQQQIRHPSPPGPMAYQQQGDGTRRETPPGIHAQASGYQSIQHLYHHQQQQQQQQQQQHTASGAQHRFAQPMHGMMGPPQQPQPHVSMLQTPQMQYRAQQQPHLYVGAGQQPRYAYIQRPEFHHVNPYVQPGQQGSTYAEGGGGRMVMRHPQPVMVQQHLGYTPTSHAQYTMPQPGRVYVTAAPGGIYHPTAVPTDSPSSVGNVYYAQPLPEQAPVAVTTTGYTNPTHIAVIDQCGGSSGHFVMAGQPQGILKGLPTVQTEDKLKTAPLKSKPPSKGRGKAVASKAMAECQLTSSEAGQSSSAGTKSLMTHAELAHLAKGIDATVTLDEDTADTVLSIVDDFVESLIKGAAEVSKQRGAKKLEAKDARFILERRYNLILPSNSCAASTSATNSQAANATN